MAEIAEELERLRLNLLDLTKRNGLLNYRQSKRRTIEIFDESPKELYNILVIQEKSMRFRATKFDDEVEIEDGEIPPEEDNTEPIIWRQNDSSEEEPEHYFDNYLNTPYNFENLSKRLFYAHNQSKSIFEEQGYSVLYLALGFLEWKESTDSCKLCKAPLILVPVELTRTGQKRIFSLSWTGDDIYTNITLQAKLEGFNVSLPELEMPEEKSGIDDYFAAVVDAIDGQKEWNVLVEISVDFFNFRKFVMYKDLDTTIWPDGKSPADHQLIKAIFNPESSEPNDDVISEEEVDAKVDPFTSYTILDADSSQIVAIEAVKMGKNMVVQGPPGTGKSQTITNIIAELLANGKSVLFVSEKMAALEVVKNRLDKAGLGIFCLELHSNKAKKTAVLEELRKSIYREPFPEYNMDSDIHGLLEIKNELNAYVTTIHSPIGVLGITPFKLFSLKAKSESYFECNNRVMQSIAISGAEFWTKKQWNSAIKALEKIEEIIPIIGSVKDNPWNGFYPDIILPPDKKRMIDEIMEVLANHDELILNSHHLSEYCGIKSPASGLDINSILNAAQIIINSPQVTEKMLNTSEWDEDCPKSLELIKNVEACQLLKKKISELFVDSIYDASLNDCVKNYQNLMKQARLDLSSYYHSMPQDFDQVHSHLNLFFRRKQLKPEILDFDDYGMNLYGNLWLGLKSNPQQLTELQKVCLVFQDLSKKGILPSESVNIIETGIHENIFENRYHVDNLADINALLKLIEQYQQLKINVNSVFSPEIMNVDAINLEKEFNIQSKKITRFFSSRYKKSKASITQYYLTPPRNDSQILRDLRWVTELNTTYQTIHSKRDTGLSYFGTFWKGPDSDITLLSEFSELIRILTGELDSGKIDAIALPLISGGIPGTTLTNTSWVSLSEEIQIVVNNLIEFQTINKDITSLFKGSPDEKKCEDLIFEFDTYLLDIKEVIAPYCRDNQSFDVESTIGQINDVIHTKKIEEELKTSLEGSQLFGIHWNGGYSDTKNLLQYSAWITQFRYLFNHGIFLDSSLPKIAMGCLSKDVSDVVGKVARLNDTFLSSIETFLESNKGKRDEIFGDDIKSVDYDVLHSRLTIWLQSVSILDNWRLFLACREELFATVSEPLVYYIDEDLIRAQDLIPTFEGNFADGFLRSAFQKNLLLSQFVKEIQEQKIATFRGLDKKVLLGNQKRLLGKAMSYMPEISSGVSRTSEVGILLGELDRKRRIMPIRKLMLKAGSLIQGIKPCFMMSPLSIAQYLDPHSIEFDVVLFDEASQVRPEDALGAALRGKQLVIMGDSKQLPPTRFFDTFIDSPEEDEDDAATASDMESILNVCRQSFLTKTLRWHYRSRHESLIAVSNQEFYDNRLYVYPSPMHETQDLGLKFVYVPEAVYDRGRSGVNRIEAQIVARMVVEHFRKHPMKTLGIGTFNVKQQEAIHEEIEVLVNQDPRIEQYFKNDLGEDFFVKNIETIQGDERDVIIVSVGFGFDVHRKLSKNFGPINQEGGERRLNVLMTRAREKCVIVSNFAARDLQIDATAPFGLRALKVFLEFAENGNLTSFDLPREDTDSPFEDHVYEFLRNSNYEVHKQVGCAGYRIDLAVVDPVHAGQYILGIECDGAQYHSSRVARDRDRLRQDVLEGLGWTIHRVWSTDWYLHQNEAKQGLIQAIEKRKLAAKKDFIRQDPDICVLPVHKPKDQEKTEGSERDVTEILLPSLEDQVKKYECCTSLSLPHSTDLTNISNYQMITAIITLVHHEGPIHEEAVIQRLRDECNVKRVGSRMREYVNDMVSHALQTEKIYLKDNFLWPNGTERCRSILRRRNHEEVSSIEWIAPEEIAEAVLFTLEHQYSTPIEDLIIQSSRVLGFKTTQKNTKNVINQQIDQMIQQNELEELPNGMLNIKLCENN